MTQCEIIANLSCGAQSEQFSVNYGALRPRVSLLPGIHFSSC